jgi:hypothetical protein
VGFAWPSSACSASQVRGGPFHPRIVCELNRIIDHTVCGGAYLVEWGLTTSGTLQPPGEGTYLERLCGAR